MYLLQQLLLPTFIATSTQIVGAFVELKVGRRTFTASEEGSAHYSQLPN